MKFEAWLVNSCGWLILSALLLSAAFIAWAIARVGDKADELGQRILENVRRDK